MKNLMAFFVLTCTSTIYAQSTLPKGIGIINYGYRSYEPQTNKYNQYGESLSLASQFNAALDGFSILGSNGESDLKRLIQEIKKFDGNPSPPEHRPVKRFFQILAKRPLQPGLLTFLESNYLG